jgi:hypothetical protein
MTEERFTMAHNDSESNPPSEYDSILSEVNPYGSQYSSEGVLYNLESDTGHMSSEEPDLEHFGVIQEILSEYNSDSCPSTQSVSNSEDETENKSPLFSEGLGVMMDSLFKNKPCFKGTTTLRKSSKKIKQRRTNASL